ncbi:hypothetical protein DL96DRAFT_418021 [Flagelloscypha sp. PMI_526]|nr:hypothetical protein DL96DRAFT_418021 [Flagelloscypha sp. PMI_526]
MSSGFRFPPDIEWEIFEWAALLDPKKTPFNLILVSKQVQKWIEPFIYRHLMFWGGDEDIPELILTTVANRTPSFLASAVQSICLYYVAEEEPEDDDFGFSQLIKLCPNARHLALCGHPFTHDSPRPAMTRAIVALNQLRILALPYTDVVATLGQARSEHCPGPPSWGITHLDIGVGPFPGPETLDQFPALTHLMAGPWDKGDDDEMDISFSFPNIHAFLKSRQSRLELVWLFGTAWEDTEFHKLQKEEYSRFLLVNDAQISVSQWIKSWKMVVRGTERMFQDGERAIERRRTRVNHISPSEHYVQDGLETLITGALI